MHFKSIRDIKIMTNINQIFNEQIIVTDNPTITQDATINAVVLEGSTINYTPYKNSNYVIYEYDFQLSFETSNTSDSYFLNGRMQEYNGSAWVDISNTGFCFYSDNDYKATPVAYRMILDSWSGSKQIRLALKGLTDGITIGYRVHNAYYADSQDDTRKSQAVTTIYSVISE